MNNTNHLTAMSKDYKRIKVIQSFPTENPLSLHMHNNNTYNLKYEFCFQLTKSFKNFILKECMISNAYNKIINEVKLFLQKIKCLNIISIRNPLAYKNIFNTTLQVKSKKALQIK